MSEEALNVIEFYCDAVDKRTGITTYSRRLLIKAKDSHDAERLFDKYRKELLMEKK